LKACAFEAQDAPKQWRGENSVFKNDGEIEIGFLLVPNFPLVLYALEARAGPTRCGVRRLKPASGCDISRATTRPWAASLRGHLFSHAQA